MLGKVFLIAVLGVCCGSIFDQSLKFSPARKNLQRFAGAVESVVDKQGKKLESAVGQRRELIDKLTRALLLKGQPLRGLRPEALLPMFGLQKPSSPQESEASGVTVQGYSIVNCTEKSGAFVIRDLKVMPDPLQIPGILQFKFDINLTDQLDSVVVAVEFFKKAGSTFIKIPCIGTFGSCTYDVCQMLQEVQTCPDQLVKIDIDCQCPFKKGTYKLPEIDAEIQAEVFPPGDYFATANIMSKQQFAGCYNVTFTVG